MAHVKFGKKQPSGWARKVILILLQDEGNNRCWSVEYGGRCVPRVCFQEVPRNERQRIAAFLLLSLLFNFAILLFCSSG